MNSSYFNKSSISSNIDGLLNESDLFQFARSQVSSDINDIFTPRQFSQMYKEIKQQQKAKNIEIWCNNQLKNNRGNSLSRFQKKSNDDNRYLNQYLSWKEYQPVTFKLFENINLKGLKEQNGQSNLQDIIESKIKELEQQRINYFNYDKLSLQKQEKIIKQVNTKEKWKVERIEPIMIKSSKNQKVNNIQISTMTENIEQQLKRLQKNEEKLTRNYQSFIQCPPKTKQIIKNQTVKIERSDYKSTQKKPFSSVKPPVFDISPFEMFLKAQKQEPIKQQNRQEVKQHIPQKRKPSIKKQDLQRYLKTTLENAGQKTIQQLSEQHKRKVYDFLYR